MPFTGVNITCGTVAVLHGLSLPARSAWTRSLASGEVTNVGASNVAENVFSGAHFTPVFRIDVAAPHWIAIGPNPDATQVNGEGAAARVLVRPGETFVALCALGDRVACAAVETAQPASV